MVCPECKRTMSVHKSKIKDTIIKGDETWYTFKENIKFPCGHEIDQASETKDSGNLNHKKEHIGGSYPTGRVYKEPMGNARTGIGNKGSGKF